VLALGLAQHQTDSTGNKVLESRYDPTIEKPTANGQRYEEVVRSAGHEEAE